MENRTQDIVRQSAIIAAACFMLIAAAVGSGAFGGTSVSELQDGTLSERGSHLAPAGPAFAIWTVIYVGLLAYALWQALPARRGDPRQRAAGWWIAASMVLNGLWLVVAQFGTLVLTVIVIGLLLATLGRIIVLIGRRPARGGVDRVLVDGVNGLHFGWVTIATVADAAAWLTRVAPETWAAQADAWAVGVLAVVLVIGIASAVVTRRLAPALATSWGLVWVAVGRLTGEPRSTITAIAALVVAASILIAGVIAVSRRRERVAGQAASAVQRTSR